MNPLSRARWSVGFVASKPRKAYEGATENEL